MFRSWLKPRTKPSRTFITESFMEKIALTGSLEEARQRLQRKNWKELDPLPRMSTWSLICEEIVDTEYSDDNYERVVAELYRRGLTDSEILPMRTFAWRTAGYLNYEMMLWDWVSLDESDIKRAIDILAEKGEITDAEKASMEAYVKQYESNVKA